MMANNSRDCRYSLAGIQCINGCDATCLLLSSDRTFSVNLTHVIGKKSPFCATHVKFVHSKAENDESFFGESNG
jgi:hypothetical protein